MNEELNQEVKPVVKMQIKGSRLVESVSQFADKKWLAYVFSALAALLGVACVIWAFTDTDGESSTDILLFAMIAFALAVMILYNLKRTGGMEKELADCKIYYEFTDERLICSEYRSGACVNVTECAYGEITKIKNKKEFILLMIGKSCITLDKYGFMIGDEDLLLQFLDEKMAKTGTEEENN